MKTGLISIKIRMLFTALFLFIFLLIPLLSTAQTDKPDLAAWLTEHPSVSQAIRWQGVNGIKAYPNWSSTQKTDLLEMYQKVWNGEPLGLTDPPPNMLDLADDDFFRTELSKDHAWPLFLAHVAYGLAVETGKWVPWSLTEYSQEELLELFDGSRMFRWHNASKGYELIYYGMPASPDLAFKFLNDNNMIAQDRLHTIGNLLDWCRSNMKHYTGRSTAKNVEDHWQYRGVAPISRVISGTMFHSDFWNAELFSHHTGGCWGTTAFLREVLRVVNIPVKNAPARGHALPYFMSEGKYLSHGDDPYSWNTKNIPFPIKELFINESTYNAWFGSSVPENVNNVGRRIKDLGIKYLHPPMYWVNTDSGTLHRLIGATVEPFVPNVRNAMSLTVDVARGEVYWTEKTGHTTGRIQRANLDGTNIEEIKSLTGIPHSIAIDTPNAKIYLITSSSKIQRLSLDGSNFQPNLITGLESASNISVGFGKVYWIERTNQIRRANLNGSGVETIVTTSGAPRGILVDHFTRSKIYWTEQTDENNGKIRQAHLNGTNVKTVATLSDVPIDIGMDTMHYDFNGHNILLYWTTLSGKIQRADWKGKGKRTVATGLTAPSSFALSGNIPRVVVPEFFRPALYWINRDNGTFYQLTGTSVERFLPSVRNAISLAVDLTRDKIYWTEKTSDNTGKVRRANLDGTNIEDIKSLMGIPSDISIDATSEKIYLTNSQGKIQRISFDGLNFQPDLIRGLKSPKNIALDAAGGKLYWTENTGRIRQANLNGSNIRTVVNNSGTISDIVVAGEKLYWTLSVSRYDNYIMRSSLKGEKVERLGGGFIRPLVGITVDTADNRIYWSDTLGQIRRGYLPGLSGEMLQRYIPLEGKNILTGLNAPGSLALGGDISITHAPEPQHPPIYWTDAVNGTLHRFSGTQIENLLPSVRNMTSLVIDVAGGKLYWTEKTSNRTGKIQRASLDGSNVELVKSLKSAPLGIAADSVNGKLYLTNSRGKVQRLNFNGSRFEPNLVTGLSSPNSVVLDVAGGKIYWTEKTGNRTGKIQRANLDGSNVELVKSLTSAPRDLTIDSVNGKLYLTNSRGKVQRLNFDGSNFEPNLIIGLDSPDGVTVDVAKGKLYWAEVGRINCANLNGENIQTIFSGLNTPADIALSVSMNVNPTAPTNALLTSDQTSPPNETLLLTNYPNPFNPETWIPYQLANPTQVTLHIYSVKGVLVRTLALGHQPAGIYHNKGRSAYWDGKNDVGESVASGIYFYTLTAGEFISTRKMLILK